MHLGVLAVMDTFYHFGTNEGTARDDTINGNHFAQMLSTESTGIDVMVSEGSLEADVKDDVISDVRVLRRPKGEGSFFESAVERRQEFSRFTEDTKSLVWRQRSLSPVA